MIHKYLTLNSMYVYEPRLFESIVIPSGTDKDTLISTILDYCGENESRYNNPKKLKTMIETFFRMYKYKYERLWLSTQQEYEMLENYDRKESSIEKYTGVSGRTSTENNAGTNETETEVSTSSDSTREVSEKVSQSSDKNSNEETTNKVSAYNTPSFSNKDQSTTNKDENGNVQSDTTSSEKVHDSSSVLNTTRGSSTGKKNARDDETRDSTKGFEMRAHGNIGVTSSQDMLRQERDIADFSWYYTVAMDFEDCITIPVY